MKIYGLIGYPLKHSYSRQYFLKKFSEEGVMDSDYRLFPLKHAAEFKKLLVNNPQIKGLNITSPYKIEIIQYLDLLDTDAKVAEAVNTIKITRKEQHFISKGYNTDIHGFRHSLEEQLSGNEKAALILGTGGASRAVAKVLDDLQLSYSFVSRNRTGTGIISYQKINKEIINQNHLIINTTPLGTYPYIFTCPDIPYHYLTKQHFLYDLVYNPGESMFLAIGRERGCRTCNGIKMFTIQADKSWEIWNDA